MMNIFIFIITLLLNSRAPCNATIFGYEGDELKGGEAICLHRDLTPSDIGIASRDLPCGTKVIIENPRNGRKVVARVVDHGPYGAIWKGRWRIKRKETDRGEWRGCIDLTVKAARLIRHNGFEPVIVRKLSDNTPVAQWESTILTRWTRWFDSVRGYQKI